MLRFFAPLILALALPATCLATTPLSKLDLSPEPLPVPWNTDDVIETIPALPHSTISFASLKVDITNDDTGQVEQTWTLNNIVGEVGMVNDSTQLPAQDRCWQQGLGKVCTDTTAEIGTWVTAQLSEVGSSAYNLCLSVKRSQLSDLGDAAATDNDNGSGASTPLWAAVNTHSYGACQLVFPGQIETAQFDTHSHISIQLVSVTTRDR